MKTGIYKTIKERDSCLLGEQLEQGVKKKKSITQGAEKVKSS